MRGDTSINSTAVTVQIPTNSQKKSAPWNLAKNPPELLLCCMTDTITLPTVTVNRKQAIIVDFIDGGDWV